METKETIRKIGELSDEIKLNPENTKLLHQRAELYTSLQDHGKAVNDYLNILKVTPEDKEAKTKLGLLRSILKYSNIDVYASTNTNMDPWMD